MLRLSVVFEFKDFILCFLFSVFFGRAEGLSVGVQEDGREIKKCCFMGKTMMLLSIAKGGWYYKLALRKF